MPFTKRGSSLQGVSDGDATLMISAFAIGSIIGRAVAGLGLDAIAGHIVAAIGFALPFVSLWLLVATFDAS